MVQKLVIKILLFLFITTSAYAQKIELLENNVKSNIDNLTSYLKYTLPNYQSNENELSNILKIYFQNNDKIKAIEITNDDKCLYSAFKEENTITFIKDDFLPIKFKQTPEKYEKTILDTKNNYLAKLIVYYQNEIEFTKEELEYLRHKEVLKVQNDSNLTPYNFNENGIAKGYSIDYLNLIANKLALKVEYTSGVWDDFLNMLENNQLDLMANVLKSKNREERFLFSDIPYLFLTPSMITRIGEKDYYSFSELNGKTIALVKGYHSYDRVKNNYPNINIYPTENTLEMIQAVSQNKADVAYGLKDVLEYNINKHLIQNLKISNNIDDEKFGFYFTFNKDNQILKSIIQKAEKLISITEKDELSQKWFKKIIQTQNQSKNFLFNKEEISYLENKKIIKMCVDPNFLPYEQITKEGKYIGLVADIISQLSKNSNIKFELQITKSWSESFEFVKDKKCDILPFTAQTTSREQFFNFTQPYIKFPAVVATKDNEFFINSLNEIKNKKVGMVKGYALIELVKYKYPNVIIEEVSSTKDGLEKVNKGEIYAFVGSLPTVAYDRQKYNLQNIRITGKISEDLLARIAIRKDSVILRDILNKAINSLTDEDRERITNKWITIVKEKQFDIKLIFQVIGAMLILFILIISIIIYNANKKLSIINKELERLSETDKLTSLFNRMKLDNILEKEISLKKRYNVPLSIVLTDIDLFKNVNDTYGHIIGDTILKEFSNILLGSIRETDFVGRWGGEEFLIILPHTKKDEAFILSEHLRKKIEDNIFDNNIKITASFGIYECNSNNATTCVSNADKALYQAKNSTRNCIKVFND